MEAKNVLINGKPFELYEYSECAPWVELNHQPRFFFKQLRGKPLEEQIKYYRITEEDGQNELICKGSLDDFMPEYRIEKFTNKLIVKDDIIVGVIMYSLGLKLFAGETDRDDELAGATAVTYFTTLACVMVK